MLRRLKRSGIASCVTQSGTQAETILKEIRKLPRCYSSQNTLTAESLTDFERSRFSEPDVSANLGVEGRRAKRLDA